MRDATRRGSAFWLAVTALAALLVAAPVAAEPNNNNSAKLRQAVTLEGVRAHQLAWQNIATLNGGNRFAGLPGYELSAEYVEETLEDAGYEVQSHFFSYDVFEVLAPTELAQVSPTPTTYVDGTDFAIMTYSGSGDVTAPLAVPGGDFRGCNAADFAGFPAGAIALVSRGAPPGFVGSCSFRLKTTNAAAAGASAILIYNNIAGLLNGTLGEAGGVSTIPSLGLTQALGQSLVAQLGSGPVSMHVETATQVRTLGTRNVLAETAAGDPDNVVMVGAHLDSVREGPGINDNGSGSGAILETAVQMAKVKPRNKVRFAWWSAEESSLVGSTRYVVSLSQAQRDDIALYLNFDMVGSPNFVRFVYDGDNSEGLTGGTAGPAGSAQIEAVFGDFFASQGLPSSRSPFNGRSDYGPFIAVGIPAGGLFTGAEGIKTPEQAAVYGGTAGIAYDPCYHQACDTHANNSDTALDQMSDAIAHAVITYAQNTEAVNGVRGKGNFAPRPAGASAVSGPGGGGGHEAEPAE